MSKEMPEEARKLAEFIADVCNNSMQAGLITKREALQTILTVAAAGVEPTEESEEILVGALRAVMAAYRKNKRLDA